ncbi:TetR family transcriptional regulator [Tessaracoccus sp. MC1627]|uniref:TetR/AcrR family transcriptional regulator n=1 Tax=Tessaracoccus sp. MC1627 TaxID=2760312 RepID=UPI0016014E29|nr:TetR family transcriptional regulator [Tessaracoccus sp. MC1627]MBB1513354.1 TetR family transcriptional regulator [Tessaracoccus sp. MC1627]
MERSATRRHDPERRGRIIAATLDLIAEHGVAGATYRTVAAAADIPLGSMTYHFPTREDLIFAAFERFADESFSPLDRAMATPGTDPVDALTHLVLEDDGDVRTKVLLAELYVLAFRQERYADLMRQWMRRSRDAIAQRVDGVSPRAIDAVQEGLGLQRWLAPDEVTEDIVRHVFLALIPEPPTQPSAPEQE